MSSLPKPFKFLASLRLAVVIILGIAALIAAGTIVEARFDSEVATKLVYHSVWMYIVMGALSACLIAVMVDRWPWKKQHSGFVLAHIGILFLLFGSWVTQQYGVDGSMVFEIGQSRRVVAVKEKDLSVYASYGSTDVTPIFQKEVNFISYPPSEEKPYIIPVGQEEIQVVEYLHFGFRDSEMKPSNKPNDGPAVRFQLENDRVNLTEWLRKDSFKEKNEIDLGPAKVVLTKTAYNPTGRNEIVIEPLDDQFVNVHIITKEKVKRLTKKAKQGDTIETGWMGLKLRILRFLPVAREDVTYFKAQTNSPRAQPAIRLKFDGESYWLGVNSLIRLFKGQQMLLITYGQRQIELPFELNLKAFNMEKYQGTERASSYASDVTVQGGYSTTISMNEPLHHAGFTFYQSSFEQDAMGKPVASVLSVNRDPGRWWKYLGSTFIVLGTIMLFYFRRLYFPKGGSRAS